MQKKLSIPLNTNCFFIKAFLVCSLMVSLDPLIVIGEKKQLGRNKLAVFLFLVVFLLARRGMGTLGLAVF